MRADASPRRARAPVAGPAGPGGSAAKGRTRASNPFGSSTASVTGGGRLRRPEDQNNYNTDTRRTHKKKKNLVCVFFPPQSPC